jgi:hypothetical protein
MNMPILLWHLILFMLLREFVRLVLFLAGRWIQKKFPRRKYTNK